MQQSSRSGWSWRFAAGLVLLAALAQACGGSSQSSGPSGNRVELRFNEVKGAHLGLLPQGCQTVNITIQPGGQTITASDTTVTLFLPAGGPYTISGILHCGSATFPSLPPDPQFVVPPGLGTIDVALLFGGVNVLLTVVAGPGVSATGPGISCPGDCTQGFIAGATAALTANPSNAVFTGGCTGTGTCNALMNASKTVFVNLPNVTPPPPPPPPPPANGTIQVVNEDVDGCCDADVTFTPGGIAAINDLQEGDSITRTNVTPGSYTAQVSYFGGECTFQVPFTLDPGENQVLNISADSCFLLRKRR